MKKQHIITSSMLLVLTVFYTLMVRFYDYRAIGPLNSKVGFANINEQFHDFIGVHMTLYKITNYLGLLLGLIVITYVVIGLIELIKAFEVVVKKNSNIKLLIFGRGPLKDELLSLIRNNHLEDKVFIAPSSKTWQKDECGSSMFVLGSKFEGMLIFKSAIDIVAPVVLLVLSTMALAGNSYNPFLYFQF